MGILTCSRLVEEGRGCTWLGRGRSVVAQGAGSTTVKYGSVIVILTMAFAAWRAASGLRSWTTENAARSDDSTGLGLLFLGIRSGGNRRRIILSLVRLVTEFTAVAVLVRFPLVHVTPSASIFMWHSFMMRQLSSAVPLTVFISASLISLPVYAFARKSASPPPE